MKLFLLILIILFLNKFESNKITPTEAHGILKELTANNHINSNRKVVFFMINQRKKKMNHNSIMSYLIDFLKTTGVSCNMYNVANKHFMAVTRIDFYINKEEILNRFKDVILDVTEGMAEEILNHLYANPEL